MDNPVILQYAISFAIILAPVIAGAVAAVWYKNSAVLKEKLRAEMGPKWWNLVETAASTLINAAEQVTGIDTNDEKKAFVLDQLEKLVIAWNIPLTKEQLDAIIEGVYKGWHKDLAYVPASGQAVEAVTVNVVNPS